MNEGEKCVQKVSELKMTVIDITKEKKNKRKEKNVVNSSETFGTMNSTSLVNGDFGRKKYI